jgi:hypothetical protein
MAPRSVAPEGRPAAAASRSCGDRDGGPLPRVERRGGRAPRRSAIARAGRPGTAGTAGCRTGSSRWARDVTRQFRGRLTVRDGQLAYSSGNDSGTLVLHEGGGQRMLFGRVVRPLSGGGTVAFTLRLVRSASASPTPAPAGGAAPG